MPDGTMVGQSIEPQRIELSAYASQRGIPVVGEFSDVISGTKFRRDGLDAMIEAARRGEFDTILIVKLDRIGRSLSSVLALIQTLEKLGVAIIATSQGIDTSKSNPCGKLIVSILGACAEFERDLISERTKAGLVAAKARGKILGHPSTKLVPDWRSRVILWRQRTGGKGLRELRDDLGGVSLSTASKCAEAVAA